MSTARTSPPRPWSVSSPGCRGSNLLLRDGVRVCLDVDDVLKALDLPPPAYVRKDPLAGIESPGQRGLLRALLEEPATPDQLARRLGRSPGQLAADLVQLELASASGGVLDLRAAPDAVVDEASLAHARGFEKVALLPSGRVTKDQKKVN